MKAGLVPVAALLLTISCLQLQTTAGEDLYWEGEEDPANEFLEVKDDHNTMIHSAVRKIRQLNFFNFFGPPTPPVENENKVDYEHVDEETSTDRYDEELGSGLLIFEKEREPKEKTLRVSFVVAEPYSKDYSNRDSEAFKNLSKSLSESVNLLFETLPGTQRASLVRIQSTVSDTFSFKVTLDIVTTGYDDTEVISRTLHDHVKSQAKLGSHVISSKDFNSLVIDPDDMPECSDNQFRCDKSRCIPLSDRCNDNEDCEDGSDERDCNYFRGNKPDCSENEFRCDSGDCILNSSVCDDNNDCEDGSDESDCEISSDNATTTTELPSTTEKIHYTTTPTYLAVREPDNTECTENEFRCDSGDCIYIGYRCNGDYDCNDGSDEEGCTPQTPPPTTPPPTTEATSPKFPEEPAQETTEPPTSPSLTEEETFPEENQPNRTPACTDEEFTCDNTRCISKSALCDGNVDCYDATDEAKCPESCGYDDFRCYDGKCIQSSSRCNQVFDCSRGEDEAGCDCGPNEFQCVNDQTCIESRKVCDNNQDCSDNSDEENCQTCAPDEWQCDHGSCIKFTKRCNGRVDCPTDRSDERNCLVIEHFKCQNGTVIKDSLRCNGLYDCPKGDYSDEKNCPCGRNDFTCDNGYCIPSYRRCDRTHDCQDGSDERHCQDDPSACNAFEFRCLNGQCIPADKRCNRISDCYDLSDEINCVCKRDEFQCHDGTCITISQRCNGLLDCLPNGEDESNCGFCPLNYWQCSNGRCIPEDERCDGKNDCKDNSDENSCNATKVTTTASPNVFHCPDGNLAVRCNNEIECSFGEDEENCPSNACFIYCDGACLDDSKICDGIQHCSNGQDEEECDSCNGRNDFRCSNGECINTELRCNKVPDCSDGSDERDCEATPEPLCNSDQFTCDNGQCVDKSFECDGNDDCSDGSDEKHCPWFPIRPYRSPSRSHLDLTTCRESEFTCYDGRCIPHQRRCDNIYDCLDFSDEQNCYYSACRGFQCTSSNICLPIQKYCDRITDCPDGSDEEHCPQLLTDDYLTTFRPTYTTTTPSYIPIPRTTQDGCNRNEWRCENGPCIPTNRRCDGHVDCPLDDSDELDCPPDSPIVLELETEPKKQTVKYGGDVVFRCRDKGLQRVPVRWIREGGRPLKPGSTDRRGRLEMFGVSVSDGGVYICQAPKYLGYRGSEERVTLVVEPGTPTQKPFASCQENEATCGNGQCIPKSSVCDGSFDCTDHSDEDACPSTADKGRCEPNQFQCKNRRCILMTWICDGQDDCLDGSDEINCGSPRQGDRCLPIEFACSSGTQCVPKNFHCDGQSDCMDGSDELGCSPVYIKKTPSPRNVMLNPGETLTLTCEAVGIPIPFITWRLNWGHVPSKCTSTSIDGIGTLTCPNIQLEDRGAYSCEALNNKGANFAYPDAIVNVTRTQVCPSGYFNSEARSENDCIRCFCFGQSTSCQSADLFTFALPTSLGEGGTRLVGVKPSNNGEIQIDSQPIENLYYYTPTRNGAVVTKLGHYSPRPAHPYLTLPESYNGNQLKSYGGFIKYRVQPHSMRFGYDGRLADIVIKGQYETLVHHHRASQNEREKYIEARLIPEYWQKTSPRGLLPASREDIMMALDNIESILLRADLNGAGVNISDFTIDSAQNINTGLGAASLVEECQCPPGYEGLSCQKCASGYVRQVSGAWLGSCVRETRECPPGSYGDPDRGCRPCPCPLTSVSNQFARTCSLGYNGQIICDCMPGYQGSNCEMCAPGYEGNPTIPGDSCRPARPPTKCNPIGTSQERSLDQCKCKDNVRGRYCEYCNEDSFYLSQDFAQGCAQCFCSGVTQQCRSTDLRRKTTAISFNNPRDSNQVKVYNSTPSQSGTRYNAAVQTDLAPSFNRGELQLANFDRSRPTIYYWSLPLSFAGDKVTSYGGSLQYSLRHVPTPGGRTSKNNAADVQLISDNHLVFHYFGNHEPSPDGYLNASVRFLEGGWRRPDGKDIQREQLLLALADVKTILIKATYTTNTEIASLISASIDTAEEYGSGPPALHVEQCVCPVGYLGTSCEDCAPGYTRSSSGLYLKHCEPCDCNGHSNICHPETGVCQDCTDNTDGDNCQDCKPGYIKNINDQCVPSEPYPDTDCNCDSRGTEGPCDSGRCTCKLNAEGEQCDRCRAGTFGLNENNPDGCISCFCNGNSKECSEAQQYTRMPIPAPIFGEDYGGYKIVSLYDDEFVASQFVAAENESELIYTFQYPPTQKLFWSLPIFPGNRVLSYGGFLSLTQIFDYNQFGAESTSKLTVILEGEYLSLVWTSPQVLRSGERVSYKVPLTEYEWTVQNTNNPASRRNIMSVLLKLKRVLVLATLSDEVMVSTSIADVSMDTANRFEGPPARGIEVCKCPAGYMGTSCETCAPGYYADFQGRCIQCDCNGHDCGVGPDDNVVCNCRPPYTGRDCSSIAGDDQTNDNLQPSPPPPPSSVVVRITSPIDNRKEIGSSINFTCEARSQYSQEPIPINWRRENGYLPIERAFTDHRGWLFISNLQTTDSGTYICQAGDQVSVDEARAVLVVPGNPMTLPTVKINAPYTEYQAGDRIELECVATGNPAPKITWRRSELRTLSYYSETIETSFVIDRATEFDSGDYTCTATNPAGTVSATKRIYVRPRQSPDRERLSITPTSSTVSEGQNVRLVCSGNSNVPAGSLDWSRQDGTDLMENVNFDNGILYIEGARLTNGGVYVCKATSSNVTPVLVIVTVIPEVGNEPNVSPNVTIRPETVMVSTGAVAQIDCEPSGYPLPVVQWKSGTGEDLGPNAVQRGNTLIISNARQTDEGYYLCEAYVNNERVADGYALVEVERREEPKVEIWPQGEQAVPTEGEFEFHCRVLEGIPTPVVTWARRGGRELTSSTEIQPHNVLRFKNISVNDEGEYICTAKNDAGSSSSSAVLKVRDRPEIILSETYLTASSGEKVEISCRAKGNPQPTVSIIKDNGGVVVDSVPYQAVLRIPQMSERDDGAYTCRATSPAGTDEQQFVVVLQRGDDIIDPYEGSGEFPNNLDSENMIVMEGKDTTITCNTSDAFTVQWTRERQGDLQRNAYQNGNVLVITDTSKRDAGIYECHLQDRTTNEIQHTAVTNLEVLRAPRITLRPLNQTVVPGQTTQVVCEVDGDDIQDIRWVPVDKPFSRRVVVENEVLSFNQIEYEDAGRYKCLARNRVGEVSEEANVVVSKYRGRPAESRDNEQSAREGDTVRLKCMVSGPSVNVKWTKNNRAVPRTASQQRDGSLYIGRARKSDSGLYACTVIDQAGRQARDYINLHIEGSDSSSNMQPLVTIANPNRQFREGENVEIVCQGSSNNVRAFWERVGTKQYVESRNYPGTSILLIDSVASIDAGTYRCVGELYGERSYVDFNLEVEAGPAIPYPNNDLAVYTANLGDRVFLPCTSDLEPPISVDWKKEFGQLRSSVSTTDKTLVLDNVSESDAGMYICRQSNSRTAITTNAVLRVNGIVPKFGGYSWISLPTLKDAYSQFVIEIALKPSDYNGLVLFTGQNSGDYTALTLNNGVPQFTIDTGTGSVTVQGSGPLQLNTWHTIRLNWAYPKITIDVDNMGPNTASLDSISRPSLFDLGKEPVYLGGVPDARILPSQLSSTTGFFGCISMLTFHKDEVNIMRDAIDKQDISKCDVCSPNACLNNGVCQEARNERGFICICRSGFAGQDCSRTGNACNPGLCGPGKCVDTDSGFKCICPINYSGEKCDRHHVIVYPAFRKNSHLAIRMPTAKKYFRLEMDLKPKPPLEDGIIMYCGPAVGDNGFQSLALKDGRLEFRYNLGGEESGPLILKSIKPLPEGEWTTVLLTTLRGVAAMTVNNQDQVQGNVSSTRKLPNLDSIMFIGGADPSVSIYENTGVTDGFDGCIKNVKILNQPVDIVRSSVTSAEIQECSEDRGDIPENDIKENDCPPGYSGPNCDQYGGPCSDDRNPCQNDGICRPESLRQSDYTCDCPLGFVGHNCQSRQRLHQTAEFEGNGYLALPADLIRYNSNEPVVIALALRTTSDGIIFYQKEIEGAPGREDFIMLRVQNGKVVMEWDVGSGPMSLVSDEVTVTDGVRHQIIAKLQTNQDAVISVDSFYRTKPGSGFSMRMHADSDIYIGGIPQHMNTNGYPGISGCFEQVEFMNSGRGLDLGEVAREGLNVKSCRD